MANVDDKPGAASKSASTSVFNDPTFRGLAFQLIAAILVIWLGYEIVTNTITNLKKQNVASGFDFLQSTAGFAIIQSLIPYSEESSYGRVFFVGLLNTLLVAIVGIILATALGFVLGVARLSSNWIISKLAMIYVEVVRNVPLLLQILFWYTAVLASLPGPRQSLSLMDRFFLNNRGFFIPSPVFEEGSRWIGYAFIFAILASLFLRYWAHKRQDATGQQFPVFWTALALIFGLPILAYLVTGMPVSFDIPALKGFNFAGGLEIIPEFVALLLALTIYTAAFIAEIVRAGIMAVSHGQTEAARSLGVRPGPTLRLIIIPQAMRVIIPPLTSQYLNLTKNSSLAVAIGYPDLVAVFAGTVLNQTGQAIEVLIITMAVYLTLSIITSVLMNWYNARMALVER